MHRTQLDFDIQKVVFEILRMETLSSSHRFDSMNVIKFWMKENKFSVRVRRSVKIFSLGFGKRVLNDTLSLFCTDDQQRRARSRCQMWSYNHKRWNPNGQNTFAATLRVRCDFIFNDCSIRQTAEKNIPERFKSMGGAGWRTNWMRTLISSTWPQSKVFDRCSKSWWKDKVLSMPLAV